MEHLLLFSGDGGQETNEATHCRNAEYEEYRECPGPNALVLLGKHEHKPLGEDGRKEGRGQLKILIGIRLELEALPPNQLQGVSKIADERPRKQPQDEVDE
jgi:hypothetical protein